MIYLHILNTPAYVTGNFGADKITLVGDLPWDVRVRITPRKEGRVIVLTRRCRFDDLKRGMLPARISIYGKVYYLIENKEGKPELVLEEEFQKNRRRKSSAESESQHRGHRQNRRQHREVMPKRIVPF